MANEPNVTIVGNLGNEPELRFTQGGIPVVNFSLVQTPRTKSGDEWVDGEPIWFRCTAWREAAENIAGSLQKGQRVIVLGRMGVEKFTPNDGGPERTSIVLEVDEIGHTLRWGTAQFTRTAQGGGGQQQRQQPRQGDPRAQFRGPQQGYGQQPQGGGDPWAQPQQGRQQPQPGNDPWAGQAPPY